VQRHLNALERLGLVTVEHRYDSDGRQRSNLYRLPLPSDGEDVTADTPACHPCQGENGTSDTREGVSHDAQNRNMEPSDESILSGKPDAPSANRIAYESIIAYLNKQAGTHYKPRTPKTRSLIKARWDEGFREGDFKRAIDNMVAEWGGDSKMENYLRPQTLFGPKFESYVQRKPKKSKGGSIYVRAN
jgi:uncharacterized phage protein (TIGR02220 family)